MNKTDNAWVDYIRVFSTFFVILLHSAAPLLYKYNKLPETHWWIGNIYDSIMRISVPLFFMISGYLLLEKNEDIILFLKKRFYKVVIPLLAWSIIFILWKHYYELSSQISLYSLYSIIITPSYYHLWFLYAIIGVYLFIPILRIIVKYSDAKGLNYYLLLWFFAVAIVPIIENFTYTNNKIDLLSISGYSGYLILGLLLGKYKTSSKETIYYFIIFIVCLFITSIGTYTLTTLNNGTFVGYFYGFLSPNIIIMSGSAFVLLKHTIEKYSVFKNKNALSILNSLSSASLGIYLIHTIFLYLLRKGDLGFTLSGSIGNPIYSIPATAVVTFLFSYITIVIIKKIPRVNIITP